MRPTTDRPRNDRRTQRDARRGTVVVVNPNAYLDNKGRVQIAPNRRQRRELARRRIAGKAA